MKPESLIKFFRPALILSLTFMSFHALAGPTDGGARRGQPGANRGTRPQTNPATDARLQRLMDQLASDPPNREQAFAELMRAYRPAEIGGDVGGILQSLINQIRTDETEGHIARRHQILDILAYFTVAKPPSDEKTRLAIARLLLFDVLFEGDERIQKTLATDQIPLLFQKDRLSIERNYRALCWIRLKERMPSHAEASERGLRTIADAFQPDLLQLLTQGTSTIENFSGVPAAFFAARRLGLMSQEFLQQALRYSALSDSDLPTIIGLGDRKAPERVATWVRGAAVEFLVAGGAAAVETAPLVEALRNLRFASWIVKGEFGFGDRPPRRIQGTDLIVAYIKPASLLLSSMLRDLKSDDARSAALAVQVFSGLVERAESKERLINQMNRANQTYLLWEALDRPAVVLQLLTNWRQMQSESPAGGLPIQRMPPLFEYFVADVPTNLAANIPRWNFLVGDRPKSRNVHTILVYVSLLPQKHFDGQSEPVANALRFQVRKMFNEPKDPAELILALQAGSKLPIFLAEDMERMVRLSIASVRIGELPAVSEGMRARIADLADENRLAFQRRVEVGRAAALSSGSVHSEALSCGGGASSE